MKKDTEKEKYRDLPYYILAALLITLPLIFSTSVENIFDSVKSTAFRILSSLFIITTVIFLWKRFKQNKTGLIINKPLDSTVILIFISAVISTIFSLNPHVSLFGQYTRQIGLLTYAILILLYFSASIILATPEKRDKILFIMEITAALTAAYSIIQYLGLDPSGIQPVSGYRPVSTLGSSVFAAGFMSMVFPFTVIRLLRKKITFISALIPIVILIGIVVSQTRTVYAALLVELILFCVFYPYLFRDDNLKFKKARKTGLIVIGTIVIVLLAVNIFFPGNVFINRFQSIVSIAETQRWVLWQASLKMFLHYPLTGSGISTFSRVIEDFLSVALKEKDAGGYYDNAHNNFLHVLVTMGAIGLAAYLLLLFTGIRYSIISIFKKHEKNNRSYIYIAFLCMFGGYIVYGLADFDEITILTYLFIFLAVLKTELINSGKGEILKPEPKRKPVFKNVFTAAAVILISFSLYNIYNAYTDIKAEKVYSDGVKKYNGNFNELTNKLDEAIELKPWSEYRFTYSYYNYMYCFSNPNLPLNIKNSALQSAEDQIKAAIKNHPASLDCLSLLALIKYEKGDTAEAEKIKNEVLAKDTLHTSFRINLSRYYFKNYKEDEALQQLKIVYTHDPNNLDAYFTSIPYLVKKKEYENAEKCCYSILRLDPKNSLALHYLSEIKKLKAQK